MFPPILINFLLICKAVEDLRDRSRRLPSSAFISNFPDPQKRVYQLNGRLSDLRRSIGAKVDDLTKAETAANFNSDADQIIKATIVNQQQAAAPIGMDEGEIRPTRVPRNYAEAVDALNDAQVCVFLIFFKKWPSMTWFFDAFDC